MKRAVDLQTAKVRARRTAEPAAHSLLAVAVPIVLIAQLTALGANTPLLATAATLANMVLACATLLLIAPGPGFWRRLAPVLLPLLLALLWAALPALPIADDWWPALTMARQARPQPSAFAAAWTGLASVVASIVAGAVIGERHGLARRIVNWLIAFGLAWIILSLVLRGIDPYRVWGIDKGLQRLRFTGTLLNPNAAAAGFAVFAILAAGSFLTALRRAAGHGWAMIEWRPLAGGWLVMMLAAAAVALTRSRAALALMGLALLLLMLAEARLLMRTRNLALPIAAALMLVPPLLLVLAVGQRAMAKFSIVGEDLDLRIAAIRHFWGISLRSPWFGYGLGAFHDLNTRSLTEANVLQFWNFGAAHNAPLNAALEAGWPFVAFCGIAAAAAAVIGLHAHRQPSFDTIMRAQALAIGVVACCSLIDIALNVPAIVALVAWLGGMAIGRASRAAAEAANPRRRGPASATRR